MIHLFFQLENKADEKKNNQGKEQHLRRYNSFLLTEKEKKTFGDAVGLAVGLICRMQMS